MSARARVFDRYLDAITSDTIQGDVVEPGGLAAASAKVRAVAGFGEETWIDAIPVTTIGVILKGGEGICGRWGKIAGRSGGAGQNFALQPRGTPNAYTCSQPTEFGHIYLPDPLIDRYAIELRGRPLSGALRPDVAFLQDPDFEALLNRFVRRCHDVAEPATRVEVEALTALIVERLITRYHPPSVVPPFTGGLAPSRLRRAIEQLEADLPGELSIDDLAREVGLSTAHFSRAFKVSTGLPPHGWLSARRIANAETLLAASDRTLADIAVASGFATQQHFTTAFKRKTGITPAVWRRERLR